MTENEELENLRAYHKCQELQVKGIYEDCNEKLCDNCDLCYAQGNTGEHIKNTEIAIQALETIKKLSDRKMTTEVLENYMRFEDECVEKGFTFKSVIEAREKQIPKKPIINHINTNEDVTEIEYTCSACGTNFVELTPCEEWCPYCGNKIDWSDEE